jgi:FkbM family methyltransferase
MKFRTAIRPLVPHFLRCVYYQRLLSRLSAEPDALRCRSFVKLGDCVIDVGANIGTYTRILSQWVGPEGSVHSYEPVPETFSYLCNNVTKFGMANVIVHNAAASSQHGVGKMHVPNSNIYRARLSSDGDFPARLVRLDDEFSQLIRVAFIKCDAERHEKEVIEGALALIERDHPAWLIETWDDAVIERMKELGYEATKLDHDWLFTEPYSQEYCRYVLRASV